MILPEQNLGIKRGIDPNIAKDFSPRKSRTIVLTNTVILHPPSELGVCVLLEQGIY